MSQNPTLSELRQDYRQGELIEANCPDQPSALFARWFEDARQAGIREPNAMTLATVSASGQPAARIVLLKGHQEDDYTFFSNYQSRKGQDIVAQSRVALLFFWDRLERQVRIEGTVRYTSREVTDAYFNARPQGSQVGAIVSAQSQKLQDRQKLQDAFDALKREADAGTPLAAPEHWGGFVVTADHYEFWQGRSSRLHDRICYEPASSGRWSMHRLCP